MKLRIVKNETLKKSITDTYKLHYSKGAIDTKTYELLVKMLIENDKAIYTNNLLVNRQRIKVKGEKDTSYTDFNDKKLYQERLAKVLHDAKGKYDIIRTVNEARDVEYVDVVGNETMNICYGLSKKRFYSALMSDTLDVAVVGKIVRLLKKRFNEYIVKQNFKNPFFGDANIEKND